MSAFVSRSVFVLVLALSLLGFSSGKVSAQTAPPQLPEPRIPGESPSIGWGLKSGAQWPDVDEVSSGFNHIGGTIGAFIDFNSRGTVGVTGDVLFVNSPLGDELLPAASTLHILEVPVMVRLRKGLTSSDRFAAFGVAGPAFNLKVNGGDEFEDQTVDFLFGGGLEIKDILFEARFKRGSRDRVLGGVTSSFTQQTFAILVGFRMLP